MAWTLTSHVYREDGESITDVVPFTEVEFGPFDSAADVLATIARHLETVAAQLG